MQPQPIEIQDVIKKLRTEPTIPVIPDCMILLKVSRGAIYSAIRRGELDIIKIGKSIRVLSGPMLRRLGIEE